MSREDRLFRRFRRRGDSEALAAVFDATAPDLLRLAHLLVGADAAEDLVQATFVDAIEHCQRYDESRRVRPWLCGLLAMHARRLRRSRAAEAKALRAAAPGRDDEGPPADRPAEAGEISMRFDSALEELGEPYRSVARLHLREGLNAREIAERIGRPAGTVRTQIVRALERLRRELPSLAPGVAWVAGGPDFTGLEVLRQRVLAHAGGKATVLGPSAAAGAGLTTVGVLMLKKVLWGAVAVALLAVGVVLFLDSPGPAAGPDVDRDQGVAAQSVAMREAGAESNDVEASDGHETDVERRAVAEPEPSAEGAVLLVREDSGEPVSDRRVSLRVDDRLVAAGVTDTAGRWMLEELPENGTLQLAAHQARVGELVEEQGARVWTVGGGLAVRGRVVDVEDRPVSGVEVFLHELHGARRARDFLDPVARTADDGSFGFVVAEGDECVLCVRAPGYETVASLPVDVPAKDLVLRLRHRGCRLQGIALDPDGQPVPHARLTLAMYCNEPRRIGDRGGRNFDATFDADGEGRFDVDWLPAGSGVVFHGDTVSRPSPTVSPPTWLGRAEFDLREAQDATVVVPGAAVGRLDVRYLDAGGAPIEGAFVRARDAHEGATFAGWPLSLSEQSDADGRATLPGLPATRLKVNASLGALTVVEEIDLQPGETRALILRAEDTVNELVVQIVDPAGQPLTGWEWRVRARLGNHIATKQADSEGIARLRGLTGSDPISVEVFNRAGVVGTFDDLVPRAEPHRLVVQTGVGRDGGIVGKLEFPGGAGAVGAGEGKLIVVLESGGAQMEVTPREGRFRLDDVPPGRYRTMFQSKRWRLDAKPVTVPAGETVDVGTWELLPAALFRISCPSLTGPEAATARVLLGSPEGSAPMAGMAERDPQQANVWTVERGLPPSRYRVVVVVPGYVPALRDLDATGGPNLVEILQFERGVPVRLRITGATQRGPFGVIANGNFRVTDSAGATVLHERFFGHFEDMAARLIICEFALAPGEYTVAVNERGQSAETGFTVRQGATEEIVEIAVE